jgi:hypothetical protein
MPFLHFFYKALRHFRVHCFPFEKRNNNKDSFAFARILCGLLQRGSAFAKGFGPIKWRGDRAVARESKGG